MPRFASPRPRLLDARGGVSWVTLLLLAVMAGGAYLAWAWVPVWLVRFEVKQVVREYMNLAVKNQADRELVEAMTKRIRALDTTREIDESGRQREVPVVDLRPEDVTWERDRSATPPTLHIAFTYVHTVRYPFLDREQEALMEVDLVNNIDIPQWGN